MEALCIRTHRRCVTGRGRAHRETQSGNFTLRLHALLLIFNIYFCIRLTVLAASMFDTIDTDNSGSVDIGEMAAVVFPLLSPEELTRVVEFATRPPPRPIVKPRKRLTKAKVRAESDLVVKVHDASCANRGATSALYSRFSVAGNELHCLYP